jgi:hypothetical protein
MKRDYYLALAASGLRMPIGTDLVLKEQTDPNGIVHDGEALGHVVAEAARRYGTPLAVPLMDLSLEKADLLHRIGWDETAAERFHFDSPPERELLFALERSSVSFSPRHQAHIDGIRYIAGHTNLFPVGMSIGPFSLMTKLLADPITAVAMAGMGVPEDAEKMVLAASRSLAMAEWAVEHSIEAQIAAGARAIIVCEPAANTAYISPRQLRSGSSVFERFVMEPLLGVKRVLDSAGVDLVLHDCGALVPEFVKAFATLLDPVILSLGSSGKLWEDAQIVPGRVVLFGNLPTKSFYSDEEMPDERVRELTIELIARMRAVHHPFILGSECDVLHVNEAAASIRRKVGIMLAC